MLSCTASELLQIIGITFAFDRGYTCSGWTLKLKTR